LELSMKFRSFSDLDTINYLSSIAEKDSIILKYSDSNFLMIKFNEMIRDFKSVEDAKKIFDHFSERNQNSPSGQTSGGYIHLYTSAFKNISLTNASSGLLEPIIQDSSKYTLVIFSASWCVPCHRLIPDLKEINRDLRNNLNLVYISVDEYPKYIANWQKLMKENDIPWRSLLSTGRVKEVEDNYDAHSIPHILLVHPDKSLEKIDVRVKSDKEKLYHLVQ